MCAGGRVINILFAGVMAGFSLGQAVPNIQVKIVAQQV
jgi:hypothetical protein